MYADYCPENWPALVTPDSELPKVDNDLENQVYARTNIGTILLPGPIQQVLICDFYRCILSVSGIGTLVARGMSGAKRQKCDDSYSSDIRGARAGAELGGLGGKATTG